MNTKYFLESKTILFNTCVAVLLFINDFHQFFPASWLAHIALAVAVCNYILRFKTKTGLTLKKDDKGIS